MDVEVIAPMVVAVVFILTVGTVKLLRPLVQSLAPLLEAMTRERMESRSPEDMRAVRESLEVIAQRMDLLEERQAFTESLLGAGRQRPREVAGPEGP